MVTHSELKTILHYDPKTGIFTWKIKISKKTLIGSIAGHLGHKGYIKIVIKGKGYRANRLAWFYMTGEWPENLVDHVNRIRNDNRWVNLRDITNKENIANSSRYGDYESASTILQGMLALS